MRLSHRGAWAYHCYQCAGISLSNVISVFKSFRIRYPKIKLDISGCDSFSPGPVVDAVLARQADCGISYFREEYTSPPELLSLTLDSDRTSLLVHSSHLLAARQSIRIREMDGMRILLASYISATPATEIDYILRSEQRKGLDIQVQIQAGEDILIELCDGQSATTGPNLILSQSGPDYRTILLEDYEALMDINLIWRKDNNNPAIALFTRHIVNYYKGASF